MAELTEAYQRVFGAVAKVTEEKLLEIELLFEKIKLQKKIAQTLEDDLSTEQKQKIQKAIDRGYDIVKKFHADYKLSVHEESLRKDIRSKASFLWQELEDSWSKKLSGYGGLDEKTGKDLDKRIKELIEVVRTIGSAAEKRK